MIEKRFTKQEVYDGINRYQINDSNFIIEILDDGVPMHYSTIVNRLNEQHETIKALTYLADEYKRQKNEIVMKVKEALQKEYNDCKSILDFDGMGALKGIADELGVDLE